MAITNLRGAAHDDNKPIHQQHSHEARALTKRAQASNSLEDHAAAHAAHAKAAATHRARAAHLKATGNKLAANAHIASASMHERHAETHRAATGGTAPAPAPVRASTTTSGKHNEASQNARAATKQALKTNTVEHHRVAHEHHKAAANAHRERANALKAEGRRLAAAGHIASAAVHEKHAAAHAERHFLVGPKGGRFYMHEGRKVYLDKDAHGHEKPKPRAEAAVESTDPSKYGKLSPEAFKEVLYGKMYSGVPRPPVGDPWVSKLAGERADKEFSAESHAAAAKAHHESAVRSAKIIGHLKATDPVGEASTIKHHVKALEEHRLQAQMYQQSAERIAAAKLHERDVPWDKDLTTGAQRRVLMRTPEERKAAAAAEGGERDEHGRYIAPIKNVGEMHLRQQTVVGEMVNGKTYVKDYSYDDKEVKAAGAGGMAKWDGTVAFAANIESGRNAVDLLNNPSAGSYGGSGLLKVSLHEHLHMAGDNRANGFNLSEHWRNYCDSSAGHRALEEGVTETMTQERYTAFFKSIGGPAARSAKQEVPYQTYEQEVAITRMAIGYMAGKVAKTGKVREKLEGAEEQRHLQELKRLKDTDRAKYMVDTIVDKHIPDAHTETRQAVGKLVKMVFRIRRGPRGAVQGVAASTRIREFSKAFTQLTTAKDATERENVINEFQRATRSW